jgi:hypothetical protein
MMIADSSSVFADGEHRSPGSRSAAQEYASRHVALVE